MYYLRSLPKKVVFPKIITTLRESLSYSVVLALPNYKPSEYKVLLKYLKSYGLCIYKLSNKTNRFWFGSNTVIIAGTTDFYIFSVCMTSRTFVEGNRITLPFVMLGGNCCNYSFLTREVVPNLHLSKEMLFHVISKFSA